MRIIFHLDLDSFYVSAERLRNPKLRSLPIAIGGDGPRSVIASASYESRRFGVRSAMPTSQARRACPGLILVPPDFGYYSELSKKVFAVVARFTPVVEQVSVDEGYLDMTGTRSLHGDPLTAADALRAAIRAETGLTASIGIAPNRLLAKIVTDTCKPDGVREVRAGEEREFLAPLEVGRIPGVGRVTEKWLHERAIFRIRDLQGASREWLVSELGGMGGFLKDAAEGRGSTEFHEPSRVRSISRETTFERDVGDEFRLREQISEMVEELATSLRAESEHAVGVRLKLRYPPFETVTRARKLPEASCTADPIRDVIHQLFAETWDGRALRLLGVGAVLGEPDTQLSLFSRDSEPRKAIERLKDEIRSRFGERALRSGKDLAALKGS